MKSEGFPRASRLRRRADFLLVQRTGEKHHVRNFLVFIVRDAASSTDTRQITGSQAEPSLRPPRLGVTVTRKVGGAVVRNRIKRLVRESFRRERERFAMGLSMVWVAKRDAAGVKFSEVHSQMQTLARRLESRRGSRPAAAGRASEPEDAGAFDTEGSAS